MLARARALADRLSSSLFFVPMFCVVAAIVLGEAMLWVDSGVSGIATRLTATVESARTMLTTVAGATLTFAGIAFSVSLLLISLASSQFSPRVVHGMFRDPFNKRVMGLVIGTFTYCLVVLRAVRDSLDDSGDAIVPSVSILLALLLGIASVLSIVAFINHAAHSMDVSKILDKVTREALDQADKAWPEPGEDVGERPVAGGPADVPDGAFVVRSTQHGWVQNVDYEALLACIPRGATLRLDTFAGRFAVQHSPLGHLWPPGDGEGIEEAVRSAVIIGSTRTLQQDVAYGVRQLADVALKAMSPGVNDPTTAHDAMSHVSVLLSDLLRRSAPRRRLTGEGGGVLLLPHATTHAGLVGLAFDEVRLASAGDPTVLIYLLEALHLIEQALSDEPRPEATGALRRQAELIRGMNEQDDAPDADRERVRAAHADWFGPAA